MTTIPRGTALGTIALSVLLAAATLSTGRAGEVENEEGWDYNIVDATDETWLSVRYGASGGQKTDAATAKLESFSGADGADGSRVADVDRDGDVDILTVYEGSKELYVYEHTEAHANAWRRQKIGVGCGASEEAIFFDFDGNGSPDIVCVATSGGPSIAGEHVYAYKNKRGGNAAAVCAPAEGPSPCWTGPYKFGSGVPQRDWYRIGGDNGSIDLDGNGCPELVIGSAGGEIGVLWCPAAGRADTANWTYAKVWGVNDAEIQKIMMVTHAGAKWLVWSAKMPNKGVYAAKYLSGVGAEAKFEPAARIVDDVYAMEFTIADVDADRAPDLVLPTREDVAGMGLVRVYFGNKDAPAPWQDQEPMRLMPPWQHENCNGLRNENIAKGVAVGDVWGSPQPDIVVMGRGCPFAANGFFYFDKKLDGANPRRLSGNYVWRTLTNQTMNIYQDDEEQKWDTPQLVDLDNDGDLDVVSSDENGDWSDTFKEGITKTVKGSDPGDPGVGTLIFWNPRR